MFIVQPPYFSCHCKWKSFQEADEKKKGEFCKNPEGLLFTQENGQPMCPDIARKMIMTGRYNAIDK